jgi:thiamine-monophosphate kinase
LSITEFSLIEEFFYQQANKRKDVPLGIGDDCALLEVPAGQQLAMTVDTMVESTHFLASVSPKDLAWKSIAVNLSDLAAMGAEPAWLTLALSLPKTNQQWLKDFSQSFFKCADYYGLQLVGGDTTKGPLTITIQAMGFIPPKAALKRAGAKPGDVICVTGNIGDAGLGLAISKGEHIAKCPEHAKNLQLRFNRPIPRVAAGIALRNIASAAIDLSDGLVGDLSHLLKASGVGANINLEALPLSESLKAECSIDQAIDYALSAGDDYELCFTIPEENLDKLELVAKSTNCGFSQIGRITGGSELRFCRDGNAVEINLSAYQHFDINQ